MKTNTTLMTKINQSLARIEDFEMQRCNLQGGIDREREDMVTMILEDEPMLHKIILNLPPAVLVNAIKKSERGERAKPVTKHYASDKELDASL